MKTIQEMLQELSQCIVTVSGEFRFRTNWNGGKVPQPDLDVFDPNVPFCIENIGDVVLYAKTSAGIIKLAPGERKEVIKEMVAVNKKYQK